MRSALLVAAVCVLCVSSLVSAQPYVSVWGAENAATQGTSSWFGNAGMIVTPTANTPAASGVSATFHHVDYTAGDVNVATLNFGVTNWLEVGGAWIDGPGSTNTVANVKVHLPVRQWLSNDAIPDVAFGAVDVTNEVNRALYFVLSKSFPLSSSASGGPRISLHAGARDGFFGGLEFSVLHSALIQAEYDGENFNADLRYSVTPRFSLDVGILDGDLGYGASFHSGF